MVLVAMMDLDQLAFELESFEWRADDRLEVTGRWYGVRGLRFVRPTLHARAEGRRRRMIALLDHKPWAADTEGLWTAAFTWRGPREAITSAELQVAPDVVLELPEPGSAAPGPALTPRPRTRPEPPRASAGATTAPPPRTRDAGTAAPTPASKPTATPSATDGAAPTT